MKEERSPFLIILILFIAIIIIIFAQNITTIRWTISIAVCLMFVLGINEIIKQ